MSSPIFILIDPIHVSAATTSNLNGIDTSGYHSNMPISKTSSSTSMAPSALSQDKDFTTQAALSSSRATQSNDIVSTKAIYDILFRTTTAGTIKTIKLDFPAGFYMGSAALLEATGIGPGTISVSGFTSTGQTLTYTVTNAVNVPASTEIRLEIANINNAANPSSNYQVAITTRNSGGNTIDGPTNTAAFAVQLIVNDDISNNAITTDKIADSSITSTKPAESYEKRVTLLDDTGGNALGWNPNGTTTQFTITEPDIVDVNSAFINIIAVSFRFCDVVDFDAGSFTVVCSSPPENGDSLHYVLQHLPPHVIS